MSSLILEKVCLKVVSMNVTRLERPRFDRNDECAYNMAELPLKDMDGGNKVKPAVDIVEQELLWDNTDSDAIEAVMSKEDYYDLPAPFAPASKSVVSFKMQMVIRRSTHSTCTILKHFIFENKVPACSGPWLWGSPWLWNLDKNFRNGLLGFQLLLSRVRALVCAVLSL